MVRFRTAAGVRRSEEVIEDLGERPGVGDDAIHVGNHLVGHLRVLAQPSGEQLGAGAQQRERRTQLVARVGDEPTLQRDGVCHRPDRAPGQPGRHQRRKQNAQDTGGQQRRQDAATLLVCLVPIEHRLGHASVRRSGAERVGVVPPDDVDLSCPTVPGRGSDLLLVWKSLGHARRDTASLRSDDHHAHTRGSLAGGVDVCGRVVEDLVRRGIRGLLVDHEEQGTDHHQAPDHEQSRLQPQSHGSTPQVRGVAHCLHGAPNR
jgi:hypothetical protein